MMRQLGLAGLVLGLSLWGAVAISGTTGSVRGVVLNADSQDPMAGVRVVATSSALQGEEVGHTDDHGRYLITGLPPGTYTIRFEFAGVQAERPEVVVSVDRTFTANAELSLTAGKTEVFTIVGKAPSVDVGSTTLGITLTKDVLENVPQGRSRNFDESMDVLPSVTRDFYGMAVGGSTSPENVYVLDGLNITNPGYGVASARLVLEFLEEFELKEGGYAPEFGRATGGFVNMVSKGGSDEFHGSLFAYYRPGWLSGKVKAVRVSGQSLGKWNDLDYYLNTGFEVGGPLLKDRLWFHVGYAPELQSLTWHRDVFARMPGADRSDGAGGLPNGIPDGPARDVHGVPITDKVHSATYPARTVVHQLTAKLTHLLGENHRHSLTLHGTPSTFKGYLGNTMDPIAPRADVDGEPSSFAFEQKYGSADGIYNYAGKLLDDKLQIEAWLGWHHEQSLSGALHRTRGTRPPLSYWKIDRDLKDVEAEVPSECLEMFDDGTSRCVVDTYMLGDYSGQWTMLMNRYAEKLAATHLVDFAGLHQIKYGLDFEQSSYYHRTAITNRTVYYMERYAEGQGYFIGYSYTDPRDPERIVDQVVSRSGLRNWSWFLQDSWSPTSDLTLNYGVRWDMQEFLGPAKGSRQTMDRKFGIYDNVAPRVGAMWDFLGGGTSKAFVHWGRFYEAVPTNATDYLYGNVTVLADFYDAEGGTTGQSCHDANGNPIAWDKVTDPATQCAPPYYRQSFMSRRPLVAPGLRGQYSDETILGLETEAFPSWVLGISGIHRTVGQAIEDLSPDGGQTYVLCNPGRFDRDELRKLDRRIATTQDPNERADLLHLREVAEQISSYPRARRDFWGMQLTVDKKLAADFLVRASYLLSWTRGNYSGMFTDNDQSISPNMTTEYDYPDMLPNRYGPLPSDRRHRFKLDGYYHVQPEMIGLPWPIATLLGASGRITSGKPIDVLAADPTSLNPNAVYLLPRGAGGRTPWVWEIDVHLGIRYQIDATLALEVFGDVFNVTNNQQVTNVDMAYTYDTAKAIVGGTADDLRYASNTYGQPLRQNPNFKEPAEYQAPISGQVGLRFTF